MKESLDKFTISPPLFQFHHGDAVLPLAKPAGAEAFDILAGLQMAPVPLPWMMVTVPRWASSASSK